MMQCPPTTFGHPSHASQNPREARGLVPQANSQGAAQPSNATLNSKGSCLKVVDTFRGELEPLMQFAEDWAYDVGGLGTIIAGWRRIEVRYGPAGQAAIAREILRQLEVAHEEYGDDETETLESLEEEFAKRRADLTRANLYRQRRRVLVCDQCDKYRWGRRWVSANPPVNMARIGTTCPSCEG